MMTKCSFSTLRERDMDLLFMEAIITDKGFAESIIKDANLPEGDFEVMDVQLSRTELDLGESDITVIVDINGNKYGLLIEDKIDAIAMKNQYARYIERGKLAVAKGEYSDFRVFIFAPEKYRESNKEAKKYDYFISYEKHMKYFLEKDDIHSKLRSMQLEAAINKAKSPANVTLNESANAFFVKYRNYQKENYPLLDLRTKETSNGYWTNYATVLGKVYIYHKMQEGYVDLTFPNDAELINLFHEMATWLRKRGLDKLLAVKTGKSAALRIEVPALKIDEAFEETAQSDIVRCFDAINELNELARFFELVRTVQ